ncbi:MAG: hypothetical protein JXR25_03810 [Pontiellaceae bacterium]|nr:hypothetical protein [Pontiellaceae bacterium]
MMKKVVLALILALVCGTAYCGEVGLPLERIALPEVGSGGCLVCIWDESAGAWLQGFEAYDHAGAYDFQLPSWNRWYWIGLWDESAGKYVFGKWIGHFVSG